MRLQRLAALVAFLALASACGGASAARSPVSARSAALEPFLGGPADASLVVWMDALRADALYGRLFDKAATDEDLLAYCPPVWRQILGAITRASVIAFDLRERDEPGADEDQSGDSLLTLYGVPAHLDPSRHEAASSWELVDVAPSGVRAYLGRPDHGGVRLFVFPDRTWILTVGGVGGRVGAHLARGGHAPPLPERPDAVAAALLGRRALGRPSSRQSERHARLMSKAVWGEVLVRSVEQGGDLRIDLRVRFESEKLAAEAERITRADLDAGLRALVAARSASDSGPRTGVGSVPIELSELLIIEHEDVELLIRIQLPRRILDQLAAAEPDPPTDE